VRNLRAGLARPWPSAQNQLPDCFDYTRSEHFMRRMNGQGRVRSALFAILTLPGPCQTGSVKFTRVIRWLARGL